ncbi:hypothetical protein [Singulisphaera acidiphila]|uniref:Uncharacterized protein n=1 Tax=Singulisphaera acidiphila (strain ATCC BAA-1392 / DSM 18658 / VKM B-2454 / MOB10) TaxID=886293 RepID=L0D852_SINAD|nr:hypothetical protein [Singulisphaera acidiphila]AGA25003.1 hypothetical protein Sinac_0579 [Singulisphaera acidiphila DSM 18658]
MSVDRKEGRRTNHRAFRPTLEHETLETRVLMSGKTSKLPAGVFLRNPKPGIAFNNNNPQFLSQGAPRFPVAQYPRGNKIATQTAHGGQSVIVAAPDGSHFKISLTQFIPPAGQGQSQSSSGASVPGAQNPIQGQIPGGGPVQPIGTVRAYAMPRGRVGLIIDGTTTQSELDISPQPFPQRKGYAHSFAYGQTNQSKILDIGQITVNSGQIGAILGFHTANLSGPLVSQGTTAIDRIAFNNLLPGASIQTGGDLNTLDVLNNVKLDGGPGIVIGRDLNLFNVGQDLTLLNGASVNVGRFLGATPQPPKGTGTGSNFLALNQSLLGTGTSTSLPSLSGYVQGDVLIGPGSIFTAAAGIANSSITASTATDASGILASASPSVFLVNGVVVASTNTLTNALVIPGLIAGTGFAVPATSNPSQFVATNFVARLGFSPPPPPNPF